jgi:hypothetical protein
MLTADGAVNLSLGTWLSEGFTAAAAATEIRSRPLLPSLVDRISAVLVPQGDR